MDDQLTLPKATRLLESDFQASRLQQELLVSVYELLVPAEECRRERETPTPAPEAET